MLSDLLVSLASAALILAFTYLVNILFGRIIIGVVWKKNRSVAYEIGRVGAIVIWTAGILFTLPVLGASDLVVSVVILLVGAFLIIATRDFTGNWFAGQMIKTIIPFRVGDWIRTPETYGRVARIDNLYTTLVTPKNETVVIPNSKLTSESIVDRTTNGTVKVPIEVEVDSKVGFVKFSAAATDVAVEIGSQYSEVEESKPPEIYMLSQSDLKTRYAVVLEISSPAREDEVASEFRRRLADAGL
jgi:small conductance mechanosensitive channel